MKISFSAISDLAYQILDNGMNGALADLEPDMIELEKAELALFIKRSLASGRKRITIDIDRSVVLARQKETT